MKYRTMALSLAGTLLITATIPLTSYAVSPKPDEVHKKKVKIHKCLLAICLTQKNKPKVLKEYVSLIALTPNDAILRLEYGTYLSRIGNYKMAITQLKKAASLNPTNPEIWGVMGITYLKLKNHQAGLESLGKAVQLGGKNKYGKTYEDARKFVQAVKQREAIKKQQAEQRRLIERRNADRNRKQQDRDEDW